MISFLIPQYIEGLGNCTKMVDENGEQVLKRSVKSMLTSICSERMIDFRTAKRRAEKILGQSNLIPIYLNSSEMYVPVRTRKPRVSRDGGYGYVNYFMIDKIMDKKIILKDKMEISYIGSKRSIMKRCKMARQLIESFGKKEDMLPIIEGELKAPATREDVLLLISEIRKLRIDIDRIG